MSFQADYRFAINTAVAQYTGHLQQSQEGVCSSEPSNDKGVGYEASLNFYLLVSFSPVLVGQGLACGHLVPVLLIHIPGLSRKLLRS